MNSHVDILNCFGLVKHRSLYTNRNKLILTITKFEVSALKVTADFQCANEKRRIYESKPLLFVQCDENSI